MISKSFAARSSKLQTIPMVAKIRALWKNILINLVVTNYNYKFAILLANAIFYSLMYDYDVQKC